MAKSDALKFSVALKFANYGDTSNGERSLRILNDNEIERLIDGGHTDFAILHSGGHSGRHWERPISTSLAGMPRRHEKSCKTWNATLTKVKRVNSGI